MDAERYARPSGTLDQRRVTPRNRNSQSASSEGSDHAHRATPRLQMLASAPCLRLINSRSSQDGNTCSFSLSVIIPSSMHGETYSQRLRMRLLWQPQCDVKDAIDAGYFRIRRRLNYARSNHMDVLPLLQSSITDRIRGRPVSAHYYSLAAFQLQCIILYIYLIRYYFLLGK